MEASNMKTMREALLKCREIALQWQADEADGVAGTTDKPHSRSAAEAVIDMEFEINAALSAPPRNCDVGTVMEQDERFAAFCNRYFSEKGLCDKDCPCRDFNMFGGACPILWAQMPYEEGGAR